jgi:hypothetical protein
VVRKPDGKRSLGRHARRWVIVKCICKKWVGDMDWIDVAQSRDRGRVLVNAVMNLWVS